MIQKMTVLIFSTMLFSFTGCAKKQLVIPQKDNSAQIAYPDNTWAKETNVEENVDISDLENGQGDVSIEQETAISENKAQTKMERITFPIEEYNHLIKHGKGTVKGIIYLKDAYGKAILGNSTRLYLNPITSYSKQWYSESYIGGYKMQKADDRLFNYLRFTASDTEGRYAFYGVPTGRYYLIGTVKCGSECGYSVPKNVRIATEVSVSGNQIIEKNLTRLVD